MPLNILHAGLIHRALPDAIILHCRRNPLDTALSIHRTYFNPYLDFPTGGDALVTAIWAVERLGAHWRAVLPPNRFVPFSHDELLASPEASTRRLVAACELPWADACRRPEQNQRIIETPSKWQARHPIKRPATPPGTRFKPWLGPLAALG